MLIMTEDGKFHYSSEKSGNVRLTLALSDAVVITSFSYLRHYFLTSVVVQKQVLAMVSYCHGVEIHSHLHALAHIKSPTGRCH